MTISKMYGTAVNHPLMIQEKPAVCHYAPLHIY